MNAIAQIHKAQNFTHAHSWLLVRASNFTGMDGQAVYINTYRCKVCGEIKDL